MNKKEEIQFEIRQVYAQITYLQRNLFEYSIFIDFHIQEKEFLNFSYGLYEDEKTKKYGKSIKNLKLKINLKNIQILKKELKIMEILFLEGYREGVKKRLN